MYSFLACSALRSSAASPRLLSIPWYLYQCIRVIDLLKYPIPTSLCPTTHSVQPPSRSRDFRDVTRRLTSMRHLSFPVTPTIPLTRPPSPDSRNHRATTFSTSAHANERSFECGKQDRAVRHEVAKQGKKKHEKYDRANGYPFKHSAGAH
ncbi:hypothetical protein BC629DRAFT_32771 [Irpex lacteus]|nr:hypothetical protein BC629DRAFT_32771 [Irpex lacteus]